jgi:hypothetical protein
MGVSTTISEASAALTSFKENVQTQGPGGQSFELAPNAAGRNRRDMPEFRKEKWKTKAEKTIGDVGRNVATVGVQAAKPFVEHPIRSTLLALLAAGLGFCAAAIFRAPDQNT